MSQYELYTNIVLQGIFTNALTGVYADPVAIQLFILDPSGATGIQIWPGGNIVRDSLGHFHFVLTPYLAGDWTYKWQGTGATAATSKDTTLTVNSSIIPISPPSNVLSDENNSPLLDEGLNFITE
jgi:hypothetical protein